MLPIDAPPFTIRAMEASDADVVQRSRVHPENERYNGWRPATVEEVARHARSQEPGTIGKEVGIIQLVIEQAGVFVGDFGVQTREPLPTVELGIAIAPEAKRRGIAARTTHLLVDALFSEGVHRVVARVDPRNTPSVRLFERLGFRQEGIELQCYWDEAYREWTDEVCFAVLRTEWSEH